jgi:uncharacterized protein (TIGR02117 family)
MFHLYLRRFIKILWKTIYTTIACIIGLVALYMAFAWLLSKITVHKDFRNEGAAGVPIFVLSNGVHTDIVVPLFNKYKDWRPQVNPLQTIAADTTLNYAAFGWGDKGFYLNTPEWSDLTFSTAFKAMFFLGTTAMHVTFYKELKVGEQCVTITLSAETYKNLIVYIENSFEKDGNGNYLFIQHASYGENDCFFEATKTYNLFFTCNTWTNKALKQSGIKACFWTPFGEGILKNYR